jgi:hypothetical protein
LQRGVADPVQRQREIAVPPMFLGSRSTRRRRIASPSS